MKIFLAILILLLPLKSFCQVVIKDGDSLEINNKRIRLQGIDAPEYNQYCFDEQSKKYQCGQMSTDFLKSLIDNKEVICTKIAFDRYKRQLSDCYVGSVNINIELVKNGWAICYSGKNKECNQAQEEAKKNKKGIWQGKFIRPELFRILKKR